MADGRLLLRHDAADDLVLNAADRDVFFSPNRLVEFLRNEGGKLTRLLISTDRVIGLQLNRAYKP